MHVIQKHFRLFAACAALTAMPLSGALAQTAEEAAERFKALMVVQGFTIEWDSVDASGDDATLNGVRATLAGQDESFPIGTIEMTGISQFDEGFRVEQIDFEDFEAADDRGSFTMEGMSMSGVILPDEAHVDGYGGSLYYDNASVDSMTATVDGTEIFTLTAAAVELTPPNTGAAMDFTGSVENFTLDLSFIEDAQQKAVIQALGYEQLEGSMAMAGSWNPADGALMLTQNDFTIDDLGTLGISMNMAGYTTEFIASLRALQEQMAENPDADSSVQGLAMLGLMQQLSFNRAEIAFDDDSLTGRVLEFLAGQQGASPATIASQAKAILPFALAQLGDPDFTASATRAVSSFLDDPQSIRIVAAPSQDVPLALIAAEAMSAPQGLIKTLGVTISAND
ncbi:hypothetical protein FY036_10615 [Mesorhizobium microcysteis]|jgi:hypothetical protein|uniref:DUF945 domain-containing protein n=1 Tax=Neoaquamicrobium microcysteis TaxID=2682781 RepID=A0A5D4GYH3_9HYPH|nr:hypothetical protein [Mesorhizobium microcysteis]TYR32929.1 hypothetical protein FY036_10615 [Mesorhizobium microcysteis]